MNKLRVLSTSLVLLGFLGTGATVQAEQRTLAAVQTENLPAAFQRIAVLGASVSAGFDSTQPFGGPSTAQYRFANYLDAALLPAHEPVVTKANALLFLNPIEGLQKLIGNLDAAKPTLVIGLDALFWFCYGSVATNEERLARFETGLRLLESIQAPLVVGDIPDASRAVGKILSKAEMPDIPVIARCNERLKAWAAQRQNVTIFPIASLMSAAGGNEKFTVAGTTWPKGKSRQLLQGDLLHPTPSGLAALAVAVLDLAAGKASAAAPSPVVNHDCDAVCAAGMERGKPASASRATKPTE